MFKINNLKGILLGSGVIGFISFLLIYGFNVLDVTYDAWIFKGYIEIDIIQHYSGWMIFRESAWAFPLGLAQNMAYPVGGMITYTDSIPLFSIFFKLFRDFLPETFQFFGWVILLSFVLQAISSSMLISIFTKDKWLIWLSSVLFVFSTVLIERSFRHSSLSSHYLILFSWYLLFKSKKNNYQNISYLFLLLNALAIMIHPYFVVMVSGILFANTLGYAVKNKVFKLPLLHLMINIFVLLLVGFSIGVFIPDVSEQSVGYGTFAMNLNALINPTSIGVSAWSKFIKVYPQAWGNYDGFNYLGFGVIFFYIYMLIHESKVFIENKLIDSIKLVLKSTIIFTKKYFEILMVSFAFFMFAISHYIKYGTHIIFHYELPEILFKMANIFRASSRIFYPVYYLIFLSLIVWITKRFETKLARLLIIFLIGIQIVDISPALLEKHRSLNSEKVEFENLYTSPEWQGYAEKYDYLFLLENSINFRDYVDYDIAAYIGKSKLISNVFFLNRGGSEILQQNYRKYIQDLKTGNFDEYNAFYATKSIVLYQQLLKFIDPSKVEAIDYGTFKVFLPK